MTRQEITKAANEWFEADKKNRSGVVLLGEIKAEGSQKASIASGYEPAILANVLLFAMERSETFAELVLTVTEEYCQRKVGQN